MQSFIRPNPTHISAMRDQVRQRLMTSLQHLVFDVFSTEMQPPITPHNLRQIATGGTGFPSAAIFALHSVLLTAALQQDKSDLPQAFRCLEGFTTRDTCAPDHMQITPFAAPYLHTDDIWLLQRVFADDIGLTVNLVAPADNVTYAANRQISQALRALETAVPKWACELQLLADQIILAVSGSDELQRFGGATVFDAFGAILLNPANLPDQASTVMALIHESSHQQMFLFHLDDPILLNEATETFSSPLRNEPRPMEGIFHAMWVSARMALAADSITNSSHPPVWSDELAAHQVGALRAFRDCEATVAAHADLTELGKALFNSAQDAVNAV